MIDLDSLDGINIINTSGGGGGHASSAGGNLIAATVSGLETQSPRTVAAANIIDASPSGTNSSKATAAAAATSVTSGSDVNIDINISNDGDDNLMTCMLITANVGTIFEESHLLELWSQQLKSYLTKIRPQLVAIHCQEVGGKNYESSMKHVSKFTDKIIRDSIVTKEYSRIRIFLDENFESLEKFTALGSLYLIHNSVRNVKLYNFKTAKYEQVLGTRIYAANLITEPCGQSPEAEHVEKVKFPQNLFPECRWSRKGFMRTRWLFNDNQPLDLVNIHLFHDASNLVAMESTPSPYAQNRQRALEFTLDRISAPLEGTWQSQQNEEQQQQQYQLNENSISSNNNNNNEVPLFIFGDFNFRLDTSKVIQKITEGVSPVVKRSADSNEVLEFIYHRKPSNCYSTTNETTEQTTTTTTTTSSSSSKQINLESKQDNDHHQQLASDESGGVVMTVGKKLFDCENLDETFRATKNCEWLQELDNELDSFKSKLYEFKISFSPSYPFKEDESGGYSYMKTRCPAWCDRILFNAAGYRLIHSDNLKNRMKCPSNSERTIDHLQQNHQRDVDVLYRLMGNSVPMGDHKPVLLYCQLNLSPNPTTTSCTTTNTTTINNNNAANNNKNTGDRVSESTSM